MPRACLNGRLLPGALPKELIPISVNPQNLVLGPCKLYYGPFGATEPLDSTVTPQGYLTPPPAPFIDFGGTDGGVTLEIDTEYTKLSVDQIIMSVGARLTGLTMTVAGKLAEITQANMAQALNNITSSGSGSGYITMDIPVGSSATQPDYTCLIIDGWGPMLSTGLPALRRAIVRKTLNTAKIQLVGDKKTQQSIDCSFDAFFVSASLNPIHIIDEQE